MYRCEICRANSLPGVARLTHLLKRPNGQIDRELSVCKQCKYDLQAGCTVADLTYVHQSPTKPVPFAHNKRGL